MTKDQLIGLLTHDNLQAFLHVIREGESSNDDSAYTILNGGEHFQAPPWVHPNRIGKGGTSTAAGAYQYVAKTWASLQYQYKLEDFSPINQDCGAVALIVQHGAMDLVLEGKPLEAIRRINSKWIEWECFQNPKFLAQVPQIFAAYGGREASSPVSRPADPSSPEVRVTPHVTEVPMAPLVLPLLEIAASLIPQLGKMFGSGTEVSNRNVAAASIVADSLVKATQAVNLQDAVEKIQNDPQALQSAKQAVSDALFQIGESGGGGIDGARKSAQASDGDWRKVVYSAPFILAGAVLPLIYAVVLAALLKFDWLADITSEVRTGVITSVTGLILGSLMGYFYGTSASSAKKDALLK